MKPCGDKCLSIILDQLVRCGLGLPLTQTEPCVVLSAVFYFFSTTPKVVTFQFGDVKIRLFSASLWYEWREPSRHHQLPFLLFFVVFAAFRSLFYQWTCLPVQCSKQVFLENCQSCVAAPVTVSIIYLRILMSDGKGKDKILIFKAALHS